MEFNHEILKHSSSEWLFEYILDYILIYLSVMVPQSSKIRKACHQVKAVGMTFSGLFLKHFLLSLNKRSCCP